MAKDLELILALAREVGARRDQAVHNPATVQDALDAGFAGHDLSSSRHTSGLFRRAATLDAMGTMQTVSQRVVITAEQAKAFLASPTGVKFRRYAAAGVIVLVPMLFRLPGVRRYPLFRALEAIGGVALVIKAAEAIRDWDANGRTDQRIVIDVPPARNP